MTNDTNSPVTGASALFRALPLMLRPGIRMFVIIPLAINITIFSIAIYFGYTWFDEFMTEMLDTKDMWGWVAAIVDFFRPVLYVLFALTLLVVVFYTFSILANIIAAPFNGMLAEATEKYLTGNAIKEEGWMQLIKDIIPAILSALQNVVYFILWSIPFLILLFIIPILGPVLWFLFTAWIQSLQYMDYPMGNHKLPFKQQRQLQANKRMLSLGFGSMTMGASMIPLVNFIVMPTAVIAATILWVEHFSQAHAK